MVSRKKVGLAFGGGVIRGFAHIGVLEVLLEAGVPVDFVAGTSAGSIMGVGYCSGADLEHLKRFALGLHWKHLARPVFPLRGFVSFDPLRRTLEKEFGALTFDQLHTPLAIVATDLDTGEPVEFTCGEVAPAAQASCSVPGLVTPVCMDGRLLADGSLADTVPVDVLRRMGAEYVIGVDIFSSKIRPRWGPWGMAFTAMEILVQRAGGGIDSADCLVRPDLSGRTYLRFSQRDDLIDRGREAARRVLPQILAALPELAAAPLSLEGETPSAS